MKLSHGLSAIAGIQASQPIRDFKLQLDGIQQCGNTSIDNTTTVVHDEIEMNGDACIYHIQLDQTLEVKHFNIDLDCADGEIFVLADDEVHGPFCKEDKHRRRRNTYGYAMDDLNGHMIKKKEMDLLVAKPFSHYYQTPHQQTNVQQGNNYQFSSYSNNADMASLANNGIQFATHDASQYSGSNGQHFQNYNHGYQTHQSHQPYQSHHQSQYNNHNSGHYSSQEKSNNGQLRFGFDLVLDLPNGGGGGNDWMKRRSTPR